MMQNLNDKSSQINSGFVSLTLLMLMLAIVGGAILFVVFGIGARKPRFTIATPIMISGEVSRRDGYDGVWRPFIKTDRVGGGDSIYTGSYEVGYGRGIGKADLLLSGSGQISVSSGSKVTFRHLDSRTRRKMNSYLQKKRIGIPDRIKRYFTGHQYLVVSLENGYIEVKGDKDLTVAVIAKGAKKMYLVDGKNERVCLSQELGGKAKLHCLDGNGGSRKKYPPYAKKVARQNIPKDTVSSGVSKTLSVDTLTLSNTDGQPMGAQIHLDKTPREGNVLWSVLPLTGRRTKAEISIVPDIAVSRNARQIKEMKSLIPVLKITGFDSINIPRVIVGRRGARRQKIQISTSGLIKDNSIKTVNGLLHVKIRLGEKRIDEIDGSPSFAFSQRSYKMIFGSTRKYRGIPLKIGFDLLRKRQFQGSWVEQDSTHKMSDSRTFIHLREGSSVGFVMKYVKNGKFDIKITPNASLTPFNVFITKNFEIIGAVSGDVSKDIAQSIRKSLDADLVFRGGMNSYYARKNTESPRLGSWVESLIRSQGTLYIMRSGRIFPVSKNFVTNRRQMLRFIQRNASYVFSRKVDILAVKGNI